MLALCLTFAQNAWGRDCTTQEAYDAETATYVNDWNGLYSSFKNYGHCDDGAIAEGFDDVTVKLLINNWNGLFQNEKWSKDKDFLRFVIRHVGELASVDESNKIYKNAKNECPKTAAVFCKRLAAKAHVD